MKNFYLTLVLLATTTAIFAQKSQPVNEPWNAPAALSTEASAAEVNPLEDIAGAELKPLALPIANVAGSYDFQYYGLLVSDKGDKTITVNIFVTDEATGAIVIDGLWDYAIKATYDSSTGSITIPYQHIIFNTEYEEYETFVSVYANSDTRTFDPTRDDIVLTYDALSGSWTSSAYFGVVGETEAGEFTNSLGWYGLAMGMKIIKKSTATWSDVGTGAFFDGGATVIIDGVTATEVSVAVQKNDDVEGEYRLVDPFYPTLGKNSYLVFDISNPGNVIIKPQTFGVTDGTMGSAYIMNYVGYGLSKGISADEFAANYPTYLCTYDQSTRKVTLPLGLLFIRFENQTESDYPYYSTSGQDSYIVLPENIGSIDGIGADDSNAPVEYFNLQGMKLSTPAAGQIVIKRQGSKVSKIAVR